MITKVEKDRQRLGRHNPLLLQAIVDIAGRFFQQDRLSESEEWYLEAEKISVLAAGLLDAATARISANLGDVFRKQGKLDESKKKCKLAVKMFRRLCGNESSEVAGGRH
mmetsp:Transcript_41428/g.101088  ORF Transcript_41428/g.101088 Transcript_41428/m.101088 type:complete len:109 (-) Transcript_41428:10-336(-)